MTLLLFVLSHRLKFVYLIFGQSSHLRNDFIIQSCQLHAPGIGYILFHTSFSYTFRHTFSHTFLFGCHYCILPVTIHLEAFFVGLILLLCEFGDLGCLEQTGKNSVLKGSRTCHQTGKISKDEKPLVEHRHKLVLRLVELGHFQIDERELVVKHLLGAYIHQLDLMVEVIVVFRVELEIQNTDYINRFQAIVPLPFLTLLVDGKCGVIKATVLEELLLATLHLYQNLLAAFVLTVNIEDGTPVCLRSAQMFRIQVSQVADHFLAAQQAVDKTYQKFLVHLRTEKHLKTEIGIRIDVSVSKYSV